MSYQRKGSHTVSYLTCHIVWVTKYRYKVLRGDVQMRCRELLIQICEAYRRVVSSDHVHMHICSKIEVAYWKNSKGELQENFNKSFQNCKSDIGGNIFGQAVMEYGVLGILLIKWSMNIWNITVEIRVIIPILYWNSKKGTFSPQY